MWFPIFWDGQLEKGNIYMFRFKAFCFLTYWGSDFTQPLGLQGPWTSCFVYSRKVSCLCAWLKRWQTHQLRAGILIMKSESSRFWIILLFIHWFIHSFIHLCHLFNVFNMKKYKKNSRLVRLCPAGDWIKTELQDRDNYILYKIMAQIFRYQATTRIKRFIC